MGTADKCRTILVIVLFLAALQAARFGIITLLSCLIRPTVFTRTYMSAFTFAVLLAAFAAYLHAKQIRVSFFPAFKNRREKGIYSAVSVLMLVLLCITPIFNGGYRFETTLLLIYSSILIPAFEELVFRGYVWNRLSRCFKNEWIIYAVVTVLFALWHLGYVDSILFNTRANGLSGNLTTVMFYKVLTGFAFGAVTGFTKLKTKNCYSGFLIHSLLNLFAR